MILDAADALARKSVAEAALAEALDALNTALEELQRLGFELDEVAELLEVDAPELTGTGSVRRPTGRGVRPPNAATSAPEDASGEA